jgi:hypothetical protein
MVSMKMLTIAALLTLAAKPASTATPSADLAKLHWLQGAWKGTKDGVDMEEHWTSPDGGGLVGMHKDTKGGRMISFEFFRIVSTDSAGICYLSSPRGAPPTPFCATEVGDARVVFENRAHDFPQRILYWLEKGKLHARIEGSIGGREESEEWVWDKAKR